MREPCTGQLHVPPKGPGALKTRADPGAIPSRPRNACRKGAVHVTYSDRRKARAKRAQFVREPALIGLPKHVMRKPLLSVQRPLEIVLLWTLWDIYLLVFRVSRACLHGSLIVAWLKQAHDFP